MKVHRSLLLVIIYLILWLALGACSSGDTIAYCQGAFETAAARPFAPQERHLGAAAFTWSPDGHDILIRQPAGPLLLLELASDRLAPLAATDRLEPFDMAWSPGGDRVAIVVEVDGDRQVQIVGLDGRRHPLPASSHNQDRPSWSPDGAFFAFTEIQAGIPALYITGLDEGEAPQQVAAYAWQPAWSPDGRYLAYVTEVRGYERIFLYDLMTQDTAGLPVSAGCQRQPGWSPEGDRLAFLTNETGSWDIAAFSLETGRVQNLTQSPLDEYQFHWSPDGRQLVLLTYQLSDQGDEQQEIYLLDSRGGRPQQLTSTPGVAELWPSWSPTGQQIAFLSFESGQWSLELIDLLATKHIRLVDFPKVID